MLRAGGRHAITQAAIGLKVEDERRKSLAEKGWARRAVVVRGVGPCGGADLEQLPGREEYGGDEDRALDWSAAALQFTEDNFNDNGAEVRSLDHMHMHSARLQGRPLRRLLRGALGMASSLSAWQLEEEHGLVGLFALKVVTKVRAARSALRCALCLVPVYQLYINQA